MLTFGHNASQARDDAHACGGGLVSPGIKAAAGSLAIADLACGDGQAFAEGGQSGQRGCFEVA